MEIKQLLREDAMLLSLSATTKETAISEMVERLADKGYISNVEQFKSGILAREALTSTGLCDGIAMPHNKHHTVKEPVILFAKKEGGLNFESLDEQATDLFFMIAVPEGANDTHLEALASLSKYIMKPGFADKLRKASSYDEVIAAFAAETVVERPEGSLANACQEDFIVAVTACATGIAHTYMAEEALTHQAEKMGVLIKVETNGASGVGNQLTAEDIKKAKGVIITADKSVDMDRFDGKRLISKPVASGIRRPEVLIKAVLEGELPIYSSSGLENSNSKNPDNLGMSIYKNLMNGVSHMLPFVVAGGVLVALSFLFGIYSADPKSEQYNQFAATLNQVGAYSMGLMVPVLSAFIAEGIAKRPGLVVGFVGGLVANGAGAGFLGGILSGFLAGYTIIAITKLLNPLPKEFDGLKAIFLYPVLGVFVTGYVMSFISGPMKAINENLMVFLKGFQGSSPIVLGIIIGCMCAFDMGGPVNKAAYVTGTALLAQGNTSFMAGVSAACIAPPLITGFAVLFFRRYFTTEERNAGLINFILGSTHITEGAIPFAAKDPLRVIPVLMLGSSIAATLTFLFKVQVPAPHGGFLVLPVVTGGLLWVFSILTGSIISGCLYGLIKKHQFEK